MQMQQHAKTVCMEVEACLQTPRTMCSQSWFKRSWQPAANMCTTTADMQLRTHACKTCFLTYMCLLHGNNAHQEIEQQQQQSRSEAKSLTWQDNPRAYLLQNIMLWPYL